MNVKYIKFLLSFLVLSFVVACAITKNTNKDIKKQTQSKSNKIAFSAPVSTTKNPFFVESNDANEWVDSVYNQLSFKEKLGQLFMVAAYSNRDSIHRKEILKLVKDYHIGGLIFFQGGPIRQANLTNFYNSKSKIPLFIGIDAEWGLGMRLDSTYRYPYNMTLGAVRDLKLIEQIGVKMGEESKRLGVHFNFAPVLDINTNPNNPIIGFRSFGETKENVTDNALALMKGVQSQGVFATGKHFPGHGDTETDSHQSLPLVNFSQERLQDVEFYPYKKLFEQGLASVMVAHLNVPSIEDRKNYPTSISYNVVTNILQKQLGFSGLIFTDALNMKGVSNYKKPGDADLQAFLAGNDILLFSENVPVAVEILTSAYKNKLISEERLAFSVKKILKYKYFAGLYKNKPIDKTNLVNDLNLSSMDALQYQVYQNAITVIKNTDEVLPIRNLSNNRIAYVKLGDDTNTKFVETLKKYTEVTEVSHTNLDSLNEKLSDYDQVIVGYHKSDKAWKKHDFSDIDLLWLNDIAKHNNVILDIFAKPYTLKAGINFEAIEGLIVSYQNSDIAQEVSAELIFGAIEAKGKLPVTINENFKVNDGICTNKLNRLGFDAPENVGMNPKILSKIDEVANRAIDNNMTPGIQLLVARKGKVVYQKSFGSHTYDKKQKVVNSDVYDIASLTKIVATLPVVMRQFEEGKLRLDTKLGKMLPVFQKSDKKDITFKELLSHYARLQAWIPFYKSTIDKNTIPLERYYRNTYSEEFPRQVADSLFIRRDYNDTILKAIVNSKLLPKKEYKYSDFTFIILKEYLERKLYKPLDVLVKEQYYNSLGMNNTMYNPLQKIDINRIPPTEIDLYFRHQLIQGYTHDMAAAMQGGVGGHAGVFSNAMDVAKIMQMYIQKGSYGGRRYFSEKTFEEFNKCHFCKVNNRRGLGFDKPQLGGSGPTCGCVPMTSFGHTGFTGTIAWADPENELVYVFLANRTFPVGAVNKLSKENIREEIQKIIYEAIVK